MSEPVEQGEQVDVEEAAQTVRKALGYNGEAESAFEYLLLALRERVRLLEQQRDDARRERDKLIDLHYGTREQWLYERERTE